MIISRTPFRVSFFGGGTDYIDWFEENGGAVLATTIDKYCYISCRFLPPFFEHKTRVVWSQVEHVKSNREIKHPAVRAVLKYLKMEDGLEIHHDGDLPARAGLGSSSTFTVGLLHALHGMQRSMPTKRQLALEAIEIERNILKETGGIQDQVATAFGGFNRIGFTRGSEFSVQPVIMDRDRLSEFQSHLMLYFTGFPRSSSEVAQQQVANIPNKRSELKRLHEMVDEAISILTTRGDLVSFGKILDECWGIKRTLSERVSTERVDQIYQAALDAGAIGGKLLGAGGGGFLLLFARPQDQPLIKEKLKGLLLVPFHFETNGSQIIFYEPSSHDRDGDFMKAPERVLEEISGGEFLWNQPTQM